MFALSDLPLFESEKAASKILKPWWDVVTDYLVVGLLMISLLIGGIEVTSASFDCLPAVDCPVSNVSEHHNACTVLYNNRRYYDCRTMEYITTVVPTEKFPLQYAKYVNSECSKNSVHWFQSHLSLILLIQALVLLVLNNIWFKLPITATIIENFSALVVECYDSAGTDIILSLALQRKIANDLVQKGNEQPRQSRKTTKKLPRYNRGSTNVPLDDMEPENNQTTFTSPYHYGGSFVDNATALAANTLKEKVERFKERIESSKKIKGVYLGKTVAQILVTLACLILNSVYYGKLEGEIKCCVDVYIPFVHEYFICSHNLVRTFNIALIAFSFLLGVLICILAYIVYWTKDRERYNFIEELNKWNSAIKNIVIGEAKGDMGFLLHLLHAYNELYIERFAFYMSNFHGEVRRAFLLNSEWTLEKLREKRTNNGKKLSLSKLTGIPSALLFFQDLETLVLIECGPLQDDNFEQITKLTSLTTLKLWNCGLTAIPKTIFKMQKLKTLLLPHNKIVSLPNDIKKLTSLNFLDVSFNELETIDEAIGTLRPLEKVYLSDNPHLRGTAIRNVIANRNLQVLRISPLTQEQKNEMSLTRLQETRLELLTRDAQITDTEMQGQTPQVSNTMRVPAV